MSGAPAGSGPGAKKLSSVIGDQFGVNQWLEQKQVITNSGETWANAASR